MKYKKLIQALSIFILLFTYILHPYIMDNYMIENPFKEGIIRFHVRANSDSKADQDLKLKVRDEILNAMNEKFEGIRSRDMSREIIRDNMDEIKEIAEGVIKSNNKDYDVAVSLGIEEFPVRAYGNMVFPQGDYETLLVEIGEAKGQNWWCVMFPPLCFVDITQSYTYADAESSLGEYIIDENQPLKLKSKIGEFFKNIVNK